MSQNKAPDFIGVGGEKTASTWIYKCLLEHPEICGPQKKELSYFDTVKIIGWEPRLKSEYELHGIEKYLGYFNHCGDKKITGEYTAQYMHDTKVAPLLAKLFPDVKIIISLRNPIDRTYSMYLGLNEKDRASLGTFEEALEKEPEFIRRSTYAPYVQAFLDHFPKEQVTIIFYEDVSKDPLGTMQKLFAFLDVDASYEPPSAFQKERSAGEKSLLTLRSRLASTTPGKLFLRLFRTLNVTKSLKSLYLKNFKKSDMQESTRTKLRETFKEDVIALEKLLNKDLSTWK